MQKFHPVLLALCAVFACLVESPTAATGESATHSTTKESAMFAAGCFWKTQYIFSKVKGVLSTKVGYTGGITKNPDYHQVCSGMTGHAETLKLEYDPKIVTYKKLLEVFWDNFNPTTPNRQGPDYGTQYRSIIFYTTPEQKQIAENMKAELEKAHRFSAPIVTKIEAAGPFYSAEEYHQNYFEKHGAVCN